MNRKKKKLLSGIQAKIIMLVLATTLMIAGAYMFVVIQQTSKLSDVIRNTSDAQQKANETISLETMDQVINDSLATITRLQANAADEVFADLGERVRSLQLYAERLAGQPEEYAFRDVARPVMENDDEISFQLLCEEGVDLNDPAIRREVGLYGNMREIMEALYAASYEANSCFIGTADGLFLVTDDRAGNKFDENGEIISMPVTQREWYTGAANSGGIYYTGVTHDYFEDAMGIVCSAPVYRNGELVAVVGMDMFMDSMTHAITITNTDAGFVYIVNNDGQIVFSPETKGLLQVAASNKAPDLRKSGNRDLSDFIRKALVEATPVKRIRVGDKEYYMAGVPMPSIGWAMISAVDKEAVDEPTELMKEEYKSIQQNAVNELNSTFSESRDTIIYLLCAIFIIMTLNSVTLGYRIAAPLEEMTKRIANPERNYLDFQMDDAFRTGDEIELLASSFADLTDKTKTYMEDLKSVTAEKERFLAELNLATLIQENALPHMFPAFPERNDFDLYAAMIPAKEVGGDFYDFFLIDENHLGLTMADVSGKGVPAALFMMTAKTLIKNRIQSGDSPKEALMNVNGQLMEGNEAGMFVTVWLAVLDLNTGKGIAANAGHEHPVIRRRGGSYELVRYRHSPAVAMLEEVPFSEHEFQLFPGDSLFVYTDGIPEATSENGMLFGTDRLTAALNTDPEAPPMDVLKNVITAVDDFVGSAEQFDDMTMLSFKYNGDTDRNFEELIVDADLENLPQVIDFVEEKMDELNGSVKNKMQMDLAVEEIFVNIAHYAYEGRKGKAVIGVRTNKEEGSVTVIFTDQGIHYDPLSRKDPDTGLSADERQIGGLGIFLTKKSVDEVQYRYENGRNILTIKKILK